MPQVSDVVFGAMTNRPIAVLAVPVKVDGAVAYSLNLTLDPGDFIGSWMLTICQPIGSVRSSIGRGAIGAGAGSRRARRQTGFERVAGSIRAAPGEAWSHFDSLEGESVYNGHSRAHESALIVGIGIPASVIEGLLNRSLRNLLIGGSVVVGLGTLIAALVSRRLANGLRKVAAAAEQVPMGRCEAPRTTWVAEIDQITAALVASARIILQRTEQRDQADRVMRQTAEELRRVNETLEERIATEIADRQRAEAALRQAKKMEAIGQLTGGLHTTSITFCKLFRETWRLFARAAPKTQGLRRAVSSRGRRH